MKYSYKRNFKKKCTKYYVTFILDWTCHKTCFKNIHSNSRNLWQILYIQFVGHQQIRSNAVSWILSKTLKSFSSHNHWLLFYIRQIQEVIWINWINYYMHRSWAKRNIPCTKSDAFSWPKPDEWFYWRSFGVQSP